MQINYPVEGEILKVHDRAPVGEGNIIRYLCRTTLPNGNEILLPNVEAPTAFGGIADYFNMRHRASFDDGDQDSVAVDQAKRDAMVGDRCVIVFINGSILKPRIVAFLQHPNQTPEITNAKGKSPQAVMQLLGVRVEVSDTGELRIIRKGAPEVKFDETNSYIIDTNALGIAKELAGKLGGNSIGGDGNKQITPADQTEISLVEFLEKGVLRARDSLGQAIELNPDKQTLLISNAYYPSYLSPDSPPAALIDGTKGEYIKFDKTSGELTISSTLSTKIINTLNFEQTTNGSHTESVTGKYDLSVKAGLTVTTVGETSFSATGKFLVDSTAGVAVSTKGDLELTELIGATVKLSKGKIAIGSTSAELLDILSQTLDALSTTTAAGFGAPISSVAQFAQLSVLLKTIKGSL